MMQSSVRVLVLRAHFIELVISVACIGAASVIWLSMGLFNSDLSLFTGAALMVAGVIVFVLAMKSILKSLRR